MRTVIAIVGVILVALCISVRFKAQTLTKPTITSIGALPSEPVAKGSCTYSTAGYLEKNGKREFADRDLGQMIAPALRQGYVITLYPPTKSGIFANQACGAN